MADEDGVKQISVEGFIRRVLIEDIGQMVCKSQLHYLSFGVIAQSIEFLGACLDEHPFDERGLSRRRFDSAIKDLFPDAYKEYLPKESGFCLYDGLRCSLTHIVRPGKKIALTHRKESIEEGTEHLGVLEGRLVLVSEDLHEHLGLASEEVVRRIGSGALTHSKLIQGYIRITG